MSIGRFSRRCAPSYGSILALVLLGLATCAALGLGLSSCSGSGNGSPSPDAGHPRADAEATLDGSQATQDGARPSDAGGCAPRTCSEQAIQCGPAGDGCGGLLQCGSCAPPQTCGGGGQASVCGQMTDGGACMPQTCAGRGYNCGPAADGCGGALDCGTCTGPQTCGGGGQASVCGGGGTDSGAGGPDAGQSDAAQGGGYQLPDDDNGCPGNCRQIPWQAGSDLWNAGGLPSYTAKACAGLAGNGTTDDGPAIQTCIDNASANTAVLLGAGTYLVNGTVRLKSNVSLRGAKAEGAPPFLPVADAAATRILLGANATLTTQNFSPDANLYPPQSYATFPTTYCTLTGSPKKGDTTVTLGSASAGCALAAGAWIEVYGNDDPTLVSTTGADGHCDWCGNNSGFYVQIQIVQVTALSGNVATLSRPLYYTPYTASVTVPGAGGNGTETEPAGAKYSLITFPTTKAGFENLRVDGSSADITSNDALNLQGCLYCWVKNVETYMTGGDSGSAHVEMDYGYGDEVRGSAFHEGRSSASGANYGVYFQFANTDAKIEDNVLFHNRHSVVFQGGGSGVAMLYNYMDDMYTDDLTYFGSARTSHGGHPYMNLWEGNIASHVAADDFWGSSSHTVFFRNWLWGGESNTTFSGGTGIPSFPPQEGFAAVDLYTGQSYYSYVDNVLGNPSLPGGIAPAWSAGSLNTFNEYPSPANPVVYSMGGTLAAPGPSGASSSATSLLQGNYDYLTQGVGYNQGGPDDTFQASYYYATKPSFLGSCPFPEQGSDLSPAGTLMQPAYQRAIGATCP